MSFDERMQGIDLRLEALTQTMELRAHMHQDFERAQKETHQQLDEAMAKNEVRMEKNQVFTGPRVGER